MIQRIVATTLLGLAASFTACAAAPGAPEQAVSETSPPTTPPSCSDGAPHPDAPAEFSQFAFLIGDYEVSSHRWLGDAWSPPRPGPLARWNGWYGLGGMAVYDEWYNEDPALSPDTGRGVNVRYYDPEKAEWQMMWISTTGAQVQDLRAKVIDGTLTMWQVYPEKPTFLAEFTVEDADHWSRTQYVVDEDGTKTPAYLLRATRIPCG